MAAIKSYTDMEQSMKLAEILPLESADMYYFRQIDFDYFPPNVESFYPIPLYKDGKEEFTYDVPCWSLASLLGVLPKEVEIDDQRYAPCLFPIQDKWLLKLWYNSNHTITSPIAIFSDNLIDACVTMIEKLHKLNLL